MPHATQRHAIIRAKLHAPRISPDIVRRDRLLDLLATSPDRPFTLISAPAGYGKSTLVAHWLETIDVPGAWFSIDESDSDTRQFLTCVIAAVRTRAFQPGRREAPCVSPAGLPERNRGAGPHL